MLYNGFVINCMLVYNVLLQYRKERGSAKTQGGKFAVINTAAKEVKEKKMITDNRFLSLEESVYARLYEEIISCTLKRGEAITELSLSARLGVSRTPIRAALRRLAEDGLISLSANRGAVVTGVSEEDLIDIYKIRVRLEGLASRTAAEKMTDDEKRSLRESVELAEFYLAKRDNDKLRELDSSFHKIIYEACGNRLLAKTLSELHTKIKGYRSVALSVPGRLEKSIAEHKMILTAIEAGDADLADRLTSEHIEAALENVRLAPLTF